MMVNSIEWDDLVDSMGDDQIIEMWATMVRSGFEQRVDGIDGDADAIRRTLKNIARRPLIVKRIEEERP